MFSQTVEYALRAVVFLASRADEACPAGAIAKATKVPPAYLSKVMQALHRGGIVAAQRGVHGGFRLVGQPEKVTVLEVVNAVEPIERIRTCPLGLKAHGTRLCPLHKRVDGALAAMESAFANTTLAEVLAEPSQSVPLCDFPPARPRPAPAKKTPRRGS